MNSQSRSNWRNLVAACAAISVFGFAFGTSYPLLSLILESRGVSTRMIGINSAMMPIGILLFASLIPVSTKHFGARNVAIAAAIATAIIIPAYKLFDSLEAWFILRLFQGMSISVLFVLSETWIVKFAGDNQRGRIVAIYGSILSLSFGAGPALVGWLGIHGWAPFVISTIVVLLGIIPLTVIREENTKSPEETTTSGIVSFAPKAPILLFTVLVFAAYDASSLSLLPVYGVQKGLDVATSANMLTALIVGNVLLQFPIGWLADKFPKRLILGICAILAAIFSSLIPASMGTFWMWPLLVLTGTFAYAVYNVALASLGDRFKGQELVAGTSAFATMWGIGALIGSTSAGTTMEFMGPDGLPVFLFVIYLALFIGLLWRTFTLRKNADQ